MRANKLSLITVLLAILFLSISNVSIAQPVDTAKNTTTEAPADAEASSGGNADEAALHVLGQEYYETYCQSCHEWDSKVTGPPLKGAIANWEQEELYAWIRNAPKMIKEGHPRGVALFNEYKTYMTAFPQLTDEQLKALEVWLIKGPLVIGGGGDGGGDGITTVVESKQNIPVNTILWILFITLGIIALMLGRVSKVLRKTVAAKTGDAVEESTPWLTKLKSPAFLIAIAMLALIFGAYKTVDLATNLGRQKNYAPAQAIAFSHELHAGQNQVPCQYCHSGAAKGKSAIIPSSNVCMNCHLQVNKGPTGNSDEIAKIYAAIGWDPIEKKYIENYEEMPAEEAKAFFTTWLKNDSIATYSDEQLRAVENQVQKPVSWTRVHNLPDHVYFNHAQHVTAGGIECQTCHGPVEEMEVLYQYSNLSMGWCINCHRNTEVNFAGNEYYDIYEKYHKEIKEGKRTGVTVEDIGGTECQKCHY